MKNNMAPDFSLPDVRGGDVKLSEILKKKRVILVFYRGGWCPICNRQLGELASRYPEFKNLDIEIVAISNEEAEKGLKVLKKIGPPFPLLYDVDSKVIAEYNVLVKERDPLALMLKKKNFAHPAVFLIGSDQKILWEYIGKTYRDRPSPDEILKAAKSA